MAEQTSCALNSFEFTSLPAGTNDGDPVILPHGSHQFADFLSRPQSAIRKGCEVQWKGRYRMGNARGVTDRRADARHGRKR
jgi:hypothetical protein